MASWKQRQNELHRRERLKYNLIHPVYGTISGARAREIWQSRRVFGEGFVSVTRAEDEIIRFLWDQMGGDSCYASAFFVYLNQEA